MGSRGQLGNICWVTDVMSMVDTAGEDAWPSYWISWKVAEVLVGRGLKKTETALRSPSSQGLRTGSLLV